MSDPTTNVPANPADLPELAGYEGQWVVIEQGAVVAHGPELEELVRAARARGVEHPFVHFVEPTKVGVPKLGL